MGGSTTQNQTQSAFPYTPSWLTPYYQGGANQATNAQASLPSLGSLYNQFPTLQTAGLTPQEQNTIGQISSNAGTTSPYTTAGANSLESFLGTPGTPSAATNAAIQEFNKIQAPQILQNSVLMGQGNSGAASEALATGQEQALVPFLQQDQQNTLTAASELPQIGQTQQQITGSLLNNALPAEDIPRQIQQQQYQNTFNQAMQRLGFAQNIQEGPLQSFPSLIGQIQNASGSTNQPKF